MSDGIKDPIGRAVAACPICFGFGEVPILPLVPREPQGGEDG